MEFNNKPMEQATASGKAFVADLKREHVLKKEGLTTSKVLLQSATDFLSALSLSVAGDEDQIRGLEVLIAAIEQGFPESDPYKKTKPFIQGTTGEDPSVKRVNEIAMRFANGNKQEKDKDEDTSNEAPKSDD